MASEIVKLTDKSYYFLGEQETDRQFLYDIKGNDYSVLALESFFWASIFQGKSISSELTKRQLEAVSNWKWSKAEMKQRIIMSFLMLHAEMELCWGSYRKNVDKALLRKDVQNENISVRWYKIFWDNYGKGTAF